MGGMVSALVADARPDLVRGTVLLDPALPLVVAKPDPRVAAQFGLFAVPGLAERAMRRNRARRSPEALVGQLIALCFADPGRIDPAVLAEFAALARARASDPGLGDLEKGFTGAARSLLLLLGQPKRYSRLLAGLRGPVLLIQGERDRLVHVGSARRVAADNPHWTYAELVGVGHTPQLEAPDETTALVRRWLADTVDPRS
jgi:pimeloyl-ACP methyl ester carboxylesterase